eukprot:UN21844
MLPYFIINTKLPLVPAPDLLGVPNMRPILVLLRSPSNAQTQTDHLFCDLPHKFALPSSLNLHQIHH